MSIASEITRITGNISDAYTAAQAKGATMPATQNSDNLATTISTISGGGVDTRGWIPKTIDANGKLVASSTMPNFAGVTDLGDLVLYYGFYKNTALTGTFSFPALTTISGRYAMYEVFDGCTGLTSVDLSALTTISGNYAMQNTFTSCTGLTSVDLSALTTISGNSAMQNTFRDCTGLKSVSFPALTTISGNNAMQNTFTYCDDLTSVSFSALTTISGNTAMQYAFSHCGALTSVSFPALKSDSFGSGTNQFAFMLDYVRGCTIHFPSNLDPQTGSTVISSLISYPNFGGTNTVLAFDLPATE